MEATLSKLFKIILVLQPKSPPKGKFLPSRVDSFSEGLWYTGKQTGSQKSCHLVEMAENYQMYPIPLTFTTLCDDSADELLTIFFSYLSQILGFDISCKLHEMSKPIFWEK